MFKVDSKFDDMEPGGRKAARDAELRPLMEDFGGLSPLALAVVVTLYIAADARAPRGASLKSQFLRPTTKIRWACSATLFESSRCPVFEHVHDVGPELHSVLQRTVRRQLRRG